MWVKVKQITSVNCSPNIHTKSSVWSACIRHVFNGNYKKQCMCSFTQVFQLIKLWNKYCHPLETRWGLKLMTQGVILSEMARIWGTNNSRGQYKRLPLLTTLDDIFFAVTIFGVAMVPLASRKERLWKDLAPLADRSLPAIQVNMAGHHHHWDCRCQFEETIYDVNLSYKCIFYSNYISCFICWPEHDPNMT